LLVESVPGVEPFSLFKKAETDKPLTPKVSAPLTPI